MKGNRSLAPQGLNLCLPHPYHAHLLLSPNMQGTRGTPEDLSIPDIILSQYKAAISAPYLYSLTVFFLASIGTFSFIFACWSTGAHIDQIQLNTYYNPSDASLKHQYFGHLMQRADSLEKTLMLQKIEGRRRRG